MITDTFIEKHVQDAAAHLPLLPKPYVVAWDGFRFRGDSPSDLVKQIKEYERKGQN